MITKMKVLVNRMDKSVPLPYYSREGDVGLDLCSAENIILRRGEKHAVATGLKMAIPLGYAGLIWDRSGLAFRNSIKTMGGVIDPTYRGEIKVILFNHGNEDFVIEKGMRVAQMLIKKIEIAELEEVDFLDETIRNESGFGSSGLK